jgi:hypothetical protein
MFRKSVADDHCVNTPFLMQEPRQPSVKASPFEDCGPSRHFVAAQ